MSASSRSAEVGRSWWFGRFRMQPEAGALRFRDMLMPAGRIVPTARFAGLDDAARELACFQSGFMRAAMSSALTPVAERPDGPDAVLFWQFPCRTEGAAWDNHRDLAEPPLRDAALQVYLGLPWATWIDKERKGGWGAGRAAMQAQLQMVGVRLSGLREVLAGLGVGLALHTVCQHVYWKDLLPVWRALGVSDLWLSHCPDPAPRYGGPALHPWALHAVNVESDGRRDGLEIGKDPAQRPLLASFAGAHMPHYLSDIRLRLRELAGEPGWHVRVNDRWHFEEVVYEQQVAGRAVVAPSRAAVDSVADYNRLLSDSVFALCPAGAGPNTLRLWEALASGAVPVLLGAQPLLPSGGSLAPIDWERIVLRVADSELAGLPARLRAIPLAERRERQRLGMAAYARVKAQRCFA